jgi:hypothetical protein
MTLQAFSSGVIQDVFPGVSGSRKIAMRANPNVAAPSMMNSLHILLASLVHFGDYK